MNFLYDKSSLACVADALNLLYTAISRKVVGKKYTQYSRKVIWDMTHTLFLTL